MRTVVGWLQSTPALLPDEYIYASIGRSIAESGRPLIRGGSAHFPALLEPIVTAPAWLIGDVGVGYRLVQTIGALAMSLAAIPVYLLARRLGISAAGRARARGLAVLVPDLRLCVVHLVRAVRLPARPGRRVRGHAALARADAPCRSSRSSLFAGLATFTRAQFAVLPIVFFLAAVLVRRPRAANAGRPAGAGSCRSACSSCRSSPCSPSAPAACSASTTACSGFHLHPIRFIHWTGLDAMMLAYASGWIIVPGALLGLWLALRRPRSREEQSFALVATVLAVVLVAEAVLLQTTRPGPRASTA